MGSHSQSSCIQLQTLKVGGCTITDSSLQAVFKHCKELRLVEISDSVKAPSLDLLPKACAVSKINAAQSEDPETVSTHAEPTAWEPSASIRNVQEPTGGSGTIEEDVESN